MYAYYVIANLAERTTLAAMRGMVKRGPLKFVLAQKEKAPAWSAFYFEDDEVTKLGQAIEARKDAWKKYDGAWRDRLGLLLLELPSRFAEVEPQAAECKRHGVVLASGNRSEHAGSLDRLAADFKRWSHEA